MGAGRASQRHVARCMLHAAACCAGASLYRMSSESDIRDESVCVERIKCVNLWIVLLQIT